jgi:hypothetical protein
LPSSRCPAKWACALFAITKKSASRTVYHPAAALIYSARAEDVVTTIVGGRIIMENRTLPDIDEGEIRVTFREKALSLRDRSLWATQQPAICSLASSSGVISSRGRTFYPNS